MFNFSPAMVCAVYEHDKGKFLGNGKVMVMGKKNKKPRPIAGLWDVYLCKRCGAPFSKPEYRTDIKHGKTTSSK